MVMGSKQHRGLEAAEAIGSLGLLHALRFLRRGLSASGAGTSVLALVGVSK